MRYRRYARKGNGGCAQLDERKLSSITQQHLYTTCVMSSAEENFGDVKANATRTMKKRKVVRACDWCRRKKGTVLLSFFQRVGLI
jgi:hypothetical protein